MNNLIKFLIKNKNKKLSYALIGAWEVVICNIEDNDKTIFTTDVHTILHDIMKDYGLENHSP